jgi:hypothetical protein
MPRFDDQNQVDLLPAEQALADPTSTQRFGTGKGVNEDSEFLDLRVANDTVRLFRHGVRVKNGTGFFCAPPAVQNPTKNAHYMRAFVDSGYVALLTGGATTSGSAVVTVTATSAITYYAGISIRGSGIPAGTFIASVDSATQITLTETATATASSLTFTVGEGIGKINAPMADTLWVTASGESPEGDIIMALRGPKTLDDTSRGYIDLWGMLGLMQDSGGVESLVPYKVKGAMYYNTTSNLIRFYNGTVWGNI